MKDARRALALVIAMASLSGAPAHAQTRMLLNGLLDVELWDTDTNSNLLSRNGGRPMALGRVALWGAVEPARGIVLYGQVEAAEGTGTDEFDAALQQAALRWTVSPYLVLDAGKVTHPLGTFAARRLSWRNPLIGAPDAYDVQYPYGAFVTGAANFLDFRAGLVTLPLAHRGYTPDASHALRPALGMGFTPVMGVRVGAGYTWGPYLNDTLSATQLAQRPWDAYRQRVVTTDLAISFGYVEVNAEAAFSSYDVPARPDPLDGYAYYVEGKYTFTPRLFAAVRLERNDYPFIRPAGPTFWVARKTDFHDEEFGIGYRFGASTLLKASYRQDTWQVNAGNAAFIRPGGRSVAVQLSQRFDVLELLDRARGR